MWLINFKETAMRIKLNQETFPMFPGTDWVDLFNIFYLEDGEIKYGWEYFSNLRCYQRKEGEGYIPDKKKTEEVFPKLLNLLAEEASKLKHLDFGSNSDKIAQIKYVRAKYELGLKEAKELVEKKGEALPPTLKCWKLPDTSFLSNIPNETEDLVYVENKGVYPLYNILQNRHLHSFLNWQPELSIEDITATKFYVFYNGDIDAVAPQASYLYSKYKNIFKVEDNSAHKPNEVELIGCYPSLDLAKSHYAVFQLGLELGTKKVKDRILEYTFTLL